jgi:hypothetical protein
MVCTSGSGSEGKCSELHRFLLRQELCEQGGELRGLALTRERPLQPFVWARGVGPLIERELPLELLDKPVAVPASADQDDGLPGEARGAELR